MVKARYDLTGMTFGKLTVIEQDPKDNGKSSKWLCKCDCGRYKSVIGASLKSGATVSCGCVGREKLKLGSEALVTHGGTKTRLYKIYRGIIDRTEYPSSIGYKTYGGRGIKMCDEWRRDFSTFRVWALANGYSDDLSIDRIDNSKGYEPNNCRWTTSKEQARNRRPDGNRTHRTFTDKQKEELRLARMGENGSGAKATTTDVVNMRLMRLNGATCKEIASVYNYLTKDSISQITRGATWKHIPMDKKALEEMK